MNSCATKHPTKVTPSQTKSAVGYSRQQIESFSKLVWSRLHKRFSHCDDLEDLFSVGWVGMQKALNRFDPALGHQISSLAVPYIDGEILHYLRDRGGRPRVPGAWRDLYIRNWRRSDSEVCQREGITLEDWLEIKSACSATLVNLDALPEPHGHELQPEEELTRLEALCGELSDWLEALSPNEREEVVRTLFDGEPFRKSLKLVRGVVEKLT